MSTRTCSGLVAKAQLPDLVGIEFWPAAGQKEEPVLFDQVVGGHAFDADCGAVKEYLDLTGNNSRLIPKRLRDHQSSRRINGSAHTTITTTPMPLIAALETSDEFPELIDPVGRLISRAINRHRGKRRRP